VQLTVLIAPTHTARFSIRQQIDLLLIKATSTLNLLDIFRRTYDGSHTRTCPMSSTRM
jgi:hypothetical protein